VVSDRPRPSAFALARFDPAIREGVNRWLRGQGLPLIEPYPETERAFDRVLLDEEMQPQ
jgi:hypothetical protein